MKLIGAGMVVLMTASVGVRIAASLRNRCKMLRQILLLLQVMENEIYCCGTPLPQVFALMAVSADGSIGRVFSEMAKQMDKRRWTTPRNALEQAVESEIDLQADKEVVDVFLELMTGIGKYDKESQKQSIDRAKNRVEALLQAAEHERSVRSKTYEVLGICAGLSVAILLI